MSLLKKVPRVAKYLVCTKFLSALSVRVASEYPPSPQVPSKCPIDLQVTSILDCSLSVFKCALRSRISEQM